MCFFFFSSRRRHTRCSRDWSSDVCSSDLFLGTGARPLGRVRLGSGNNGSDGTEGCVQGGVIGTYLHGSLLPKNPHLADYLIRRALSRRGMAELAPLDDSTELAAHAK